MKKITQKEWNEMHTDYKSTIDGVKHIVCLENDATVLCPVEIEG